MAKSKTKTSSGENLEEAAEVAVVEQSEAPDVIDITVVEELETAKVKIDFEIVDPPFAVEFLTNCVIFKASATGRPDAISYKKGACIMVNSVEALQLDAQRIQYRKVG